MTEVVTISTSTRAAAVRFLEAVPLLLPNERSALLHALLNVAFAEGAQSVVELARAIGETRETIAKARHA